MVLMLLLPSQAIEINVVIYYHCQTDLCVCSLFSLATADADRRDGKTWREREKSAGLRR